MTASLRHAAGSLLVVGLAGTELSGLERAWLKLVRPAGIILFRRNIADAAQTRALLNHASTHCAPYNFRCVDVEGGSVDRLRDALAPLPSAQAVALAARQTGNISLIREHGELVARSAKAFGFNTTLAPVLDLALSASATVMGTRTAAPTPAGVVEYGSYFLEGLRMHGVVGCGKHFPGLGGGTLDSHLETPAIHRAMRELNQNDLVPYLELRDQLPMIMVNHAAYPETPGGNRPASVSPYWITRVLRRRIGYRGIVFSDDLEMGGILKVCSIEEAAIGAIRAGMDLLEICHSPELILRVYESMVAEGERSVAFHNLMVIRAKETRRKRMKLFAGGAPAALSPRQFQALRTRIERFRETIASSQRATETQPV
jgi:beta-N-acetylhexosaminidase